MAYKKCNSPEFLMNFINIYKSNVCLWKIKDPTYLNRDLREKAYTELLTYYQTFDSSATKDTVRAKINNLRSSFRKELKKVRRSKSSATSENEIYIPTLWYYKLLSFTAEHELPNDDTDVEGIEVEADIVFNYSNENTLSPVPSVNFENAPSPPRTPSRSSSHSITTTRKLRRSRGHVIPAEYQHVSKLDDDEFVAIGTTVAYKLRRMNEDQRNIAEHLVHSILYYGLQNKLDESTYISSLKKPPIKIFMD